jgi:Histidine kinase-, DNA gyrase B-, and HSP90-like ATPase
MKTTTKKRNAVNGRAAGSKADKPLRLFDGAAEDLRAQHDYAAVFSDRDIDLTVSIAEAFVEGMRKTGYKSTGTALDELIDNSIQANATRIDVIADSNDAGDITAIAVIDDGHGMEPQMIRLAVSWGGSHRAYYRHFSGFGKFGFGLPTASIHLGTKYTVYSRLQDQPFHNVTIDVTKLAEYRDDETHRIIVPPTKSEPLPAWVSLYLQEQQLDLKSGTIIVIDDLDRDQVGWNDAKRFHTEMLQHLGAYYRNYLGKVPMYVNGKPVQLVDPLFIMEGARYSDVDTERAVPYPGKTIVMKNADGTELGTIKIRYSYLPPTFPNVDKTVDRSKKNDRWKVLKAYNDGVIIMRAGRQIDIVAPSKWKDQIHRDYYWGVELDFTPSLDHLFNVNATKQSARPSEQIWGLLEQHDVRKTIEQMAARNQEERAERRNRMDGKNQPRHSERAAAAARANRDAPDLDTTRVEEAQRNFAAEVQRRHDIFPDQTRAAITERLERDIQARPYILTTENHKEGPFYRVEAFGGQRRLILNSSHRFFTELYAHDAMRPAAKTALETLLFVLADCEFEAKGQRMAFYRSERQQQWSVRLDEVIGHLDDFVDRDAETMEQMELDIAVPDGD